MSTTSEAEQAQEQAHIRTTFKVANQIKHIYTGGKVDVSEVTGRLVCLCSDVVSVVDTSSGQLEVAIEGVRIPILPCSAVTELPCRTLKYSARSLCTLKATRS